MAPVRLSKGLILTLIFCFVIQQSGIAVSKIIFPWRAASHIVQQGDEFELLLRMDGSSSIDSVVLKGPYSKAVCGITSMIAGTFVYDPYTRETANLKMIVSVPPGTPEDMYDILVYSDNELTASKRSLKVVQKFKDKYTLIHITDPHISRNWVGSAKDGYAEELILMDKLVDVINIIGPDLVICTGDCIHDYTRFNPAPDGWGGTQVRGLDDRPYIEEKWENYYEGAKGFKGLQAMNAPTFSIPGNHDFYGVDSCLKKSKQWSQNCGFRAFPFSYGNTRYLMADDFLGDQNEYETVFAPYLHNRGSGDLRIVSHHDRSKRDLEFFDNHSVNLELYGHQHDPKVDTIGVTPTLSMRAGSATRTDWHHYDETTGWYRIIWIDKGDITWSPALQFSVDPHKPHNEIENMLSVDPHSPTEVSIRNLYEIDIPAAKIRFVLPKGSYEPDSGYLEQSFDNDTATVMDVRVDLTSRSTTKVSVRELE